MARNARDGDDAVRVLHVVTRSEWGGAQRIVTLLATRADVDAEVACGPGGRLIDELEVFGVPVHVLPSLRSPPSPAADARTLASLVGVLRDGDYDLVHCHSTKAGALGRIAALATGVPRMFTVHGWGFYNEGYGTLRPLLVTGERALARISDAVVCVSRNDLERGREENVLGPRRGRVVYNGIPAPTPDPGHAGLHEVLDVDPDRAVVGSVGRLSDQKDPLSILRTAERLGERGHDVTAVLVGDGPLREECQTYADEHAVDARIPGFRDDAMALLADIDVFLLPSRFEGLPLTVLEAMHLGVPIVAHDVGGVPEAVVDGETGYVVERGDDGAFVERAERLIADEEHREQLGSNARERARERFTVDRLIREYEAIYREIRSR